MADAAPEGPADLALLEAVKALNLDRARRPDKLDKADKADKADNVPNSLLKSVNAAIKKLRTDLRRPLTSITDGPSAITRVRAASTCRTA